MSDVILVLNTGSSSIKVAAYAVDGALDEAPILKGHVSGIGAHLKAELHDGAGAPLALSHKLAAGADSDGCIETFLGELRDHLSGHHVRAIGHRIVHGGLLFTGATILDAAAITSLAEFTPLAPAHQPHNLFGVEVAGRLWPDVPQIGSFDTAFHRTQSSLAQMFAIPREMTARGMIRYGFHGLSYAYIARSLPKHLSSEARGRVVVAHLGHGASMCAMKELKSVATTMGFTALDGLPMGTRAGNIDPGLLLYLFEEKGMSVRDVSTLLYDKSGLLGVSGISDDMADLLASDHPAAKEAVDFFVYRIVREAGSLIAALRGLDAIVFTAGIGEHAAPIRTRVCERLAWLGAALDPQANAAHASCIAAPHSRLDLRVIATDEESMIARHTLDLMDAP